MRQDKQPTTTILTDKQEKFINVPNRMIHQWLRIIGPSAFSVWCGLKSFCYKEGPTIIDVRIKDWAFLFGMAESTFRTALGVLEKHHLITIRKPEGTDRLMHRPLKIDIEIPENPTNKDRKGLDVFPEDCRFHDPIFQNEEWRVCYLKLAKGENYIYMNSEQLNSGFPRIGNQVSGHLSDKTPSREDRNVEKIKKNTSSDGGIEKKSKTPIQDTSIARPEDFDEVWPHFPKGETDSGNIRQAGKSQARQAWIKACTSPSFELCRPPRKDIAIKILQTYTEEFTPRFRAMATTFINGGRWENYPDLLAQARSSTETPIPQNENFSTLEKRLRITLDKIGKQWNAAGRELANEGFEPDPAPKIIRAFRQSFSSLSTDEFTSKIQRYTRFLEIQYNQVGKGADSTRWKRFCPQGPEVKEEGYYWNFYVNVYCVQNREEP